MKEINRNFPWCDEYSDKSFLGILHEEEMWSDSEYFKLETNLYELAVKYQGSTTLPREVAWRTMRVFSYSMLLLGCHFNPDDYFIIQGLNSEDIRQRTERLQLTFEGFFEGTMPDNDIFEYTGTATQKNS